MPVIDRFIRWGARTFTADPWHRVAYQPVLYFFLWGAAVRVWLDNDEPAIPFNVLASGVDHIWLFLSLFCPPLALLSWFLVSGRIRWRRAALAGLWTRLSADVGQFAALLAYHVVTLREAVMREAEVQVYFRYITGAGVVFVLLLVVRDVWAIVTMERLAVGLRVIEEREQA